MNGLTDEFLDKARPVLDRCKAQLLEDRCLTATLLEKDLCAVWNLGYQELKEFMIALLETEYYVLAAWFMEHGFPATPSEFYLPLLDLYGAGKGVGQLEERREKFWNVELNRKTSEDQ